MEELTHSSRSLHGKINSSSSSNQDCWTGIGAYYPSLELFLLAQLLV